MLPPRRLHRFSSDEIVPGRRRRSLGVGILLGAVVAAVLPVSASAATVAAPGLWENGSSAVKLHGRWTKNSTRTASGGTFANLARSGYAELSFRATGVSWISRTGPYAGIAEVYVDGAKVKKVDLYAKKTRFQQTVYAVKGLPDRKHTIRVVRTGKKNKASRGSNLILDAFRVLDITPPDPPTRLVAEPTRTGFGLSWTNSSAPDLAGYRVYRRTGATARVLVATVPATTTSFRDVGLADQATYRYSAVAFDKVGNASAPSAELVVATPPAPSYAAVRFAVCPRPSVTVSTTAELLRALGQAGPGTTIAMKPGIYRTPYSVNVRARGTAAAPIWVCGPRSAVLEGPGVKGSGGFRVDGSTHLVIAGITVRNSQKGISVMNSSFVTIADTLVEHIGDEAIHLKNNTTDGVVVANTIRDTGSMTAMYGEGVYIGTAKPNWCAYNGCQPDRSDRNAVVLNQISGTTAEPIDVKEGAVDGLVAQNNLDGAAMTTGQTLISVQTDGWVVAHNRGSNAPRDGIQVWQVHEVWGKNNVVYGNQFSGRMSGYAVRLAYAELGNVVGCDTVPAKNSLGVSNKTCQQ